MPEMLTIRQRWAAVLKAGRKKRNLTRPQLARAVGLSEQMIRAIESGYRSPSPETLYRLVLYLQISPWDLFYDEAPR